MPRPTAAQLAFGTATVVLSTLAMLLLSQARSGAGIAVAAGTGLALGVLAALAVPAPHPTRGARPARPGHGEHLTRPSAAGERHTPAVRRPQHAGAGPRADARSPRR